MSISECRCDAPVVPHRLRKTEQRSAHVDFRFGRARVIEPRPRLRLQSIVHGRLHRKAVPVDLHGRHDATRGSKVAVRVRCVLTEVEVRAVESGLGLRVGREYTLERGLRAGTAGSVVGCDWDWDWDWVDCGGNTSTRTRPRSGLGPVGWCCADTLSRGACATTAVTRQSCANCLAGARIRPSLSESAGSYTNRSYDDMRTGGHAVGACTNKLVGHRFIWSRLRLCGLRKDESLPVFTAPMLPLCNTSCG